MILETILITLGIVVFAAWLIRRLLGIQSGRWGATIAAVLIGETVTVGVLLLVTGRVIDLDWYWYPIGCGLVVVLSMATLAAFELARRDRPPRPFAIPHPMRAVRRRLHRTRRYIQVSAIAIRNGLLSSLGDDPANRGVAVGRALRATFEQAGGIFVKLGQAMASQPQLVSPAVATELARLQEQAAASDPAAAMQVLHDELGPVEDIFDTFDTEPIGTASIGQTYFATLRGGERVVVKVQRPGVQESVAGDLEILTRLAARLEHRAAWARSLGMTELVAGFAESTREELDFRIEAANCDDTVTELRESDSITVPAVHRELTTARVIVQERVMGRSIGTPGALDALSAHTRKKLADHLLALIARLMLDGRRFHADPHPGNVFIGDDGRLALIDFGSVGRLNRYERLGLLDLFRGLRAEDPALMRQAALRFGAPTTRVDTDALDRELARLLTRAILPGGRLNPAAVGDMVVVFRDYGIRLPRSITALFRTLFTIMGTLEVLSPGYDLIGAINRLAGDLGGSAPTFTSVQQFVQDQAVTLTRLPGDIDELVRTFARGDLRTRVSLFSEPDDVRVLRTMVNRAVLSGIGAVLLIGSTILLTVSGVTQTEDALRAIGGLGLAFGSLLLLRTVIQILRERD